MRQVNFSRLHLLLLCLAIPFCANINAEVPTAVPINSLNAYHTAPPVQDNNTGVLPFSDPFFENYPLQREYEDARSPLRFLSQVFVRPALLLISAASVSMPGRRLFIFPTLYTRAIIYPFHSFM